jgi:hypothetical protein
MLEELFRSPLLNARKAASLNTRKAASSSSPLPPEKARGANTAGLSGQARQSGEHAFAAALEVSDRLDPQ